MATLNFQHLFSPFRLKNLVLKNRIVSTAHGTYMAVGGRQTPQMAAYHAARAAGGVGLIILEATSTHETGIGASRYATAHTDDCIPGYEAVIAAIHVHEVPVFVQLYHPGHDDIAGTSDDGSIRPVFSASPVLCETNQLVSRQLSGAMIEDIVQSYGHAARRLKCAGADGIEISAHHGHLLSQFLSERTNLRTDAYGGGFEGRFKLLRDILASVRMALGDDCVLGLRIGCGEERADEVETGSAMAIARAVDRLSEVDYIHITPGSCATFNGMSHVAASMAFAAGYAEQLFSEVRRATSKPLMVTGRINDPRLADKLIAANVADLTGMTRALICDPLMPSKAASGRAEHIRFCIACNQACIGHGRTGGHVSCIQNPASGRETRLVGASQTERRLAVLVVGGGPAGMKAAVTAAERGHAVQLWERESRLGGQVRLAERLPGRAEFGGMITNLETELRFSGVEIVLNRSVTAAEVARLQPEAIVIATGADAHRPRFETNGEMAVVHAWDVVSGHAKVGASVVIADAKLDWVAIGAAEMLARAGSNVRLCAIGYTPGENTPYGVKGHLLGVLHSLGVCVTPLARLFGTAGDTVYFEHATTHQPIAFEGIDTLVLSYGGASNTELETSLEGFRDRLRIVGDCLSPRTAEEAILEGYCAGLAL